MQHHSIPFSTSLYLFALHLSISPGFGPHLTKIKSRVKCYDKDLEEWHVDPLQLKLLQFTTVILVINKLSRQFYIRGRS